jgi:putative intracellular protease/amidase
VLTVGFTPAAVISMGGLRVTPHLTLADVAAEDVRLLILPGGDMWEREEAYPRVELETLLEQMISAHRPIAAICAATVALARARLLDERRHTSNMPAYLAEQVPAYRGSARYDSALAVTDGGIITASGLGAVDFARAIFAELAVFTPADEALWYDMFKHGRLPRSAT